MSRVEKFVYEQQGNNAEPLVAVYRKELSDGKDTYTTVPINRDKPGTLAGGMLDVERMAPDTYMLTDRPGETSRLVRAMLIHAAFRRDELDVKMLATTIPTGDENAIATYKSLGFSDGWGEAQDGELILINNGSTSVTRLATAALQHARMHRRDRPT